MNIEQVVWLVECYEQIETQITELGHMADRMNISVHEMRLVDGSWPIIPLLLAKSNILLAITKERG